jgi:hypothetical protein
MSHLSNHPASDEIISKDSDCTTPSSSEKSGKNTWEYFERLEERRALRQERRALKQKQQADSITEYSSVSPSLNQKDADEEKVGLTNSIN